jgi:hypothetical protein
MIFLGSGGTCVRDLARPVLLGLIAVVLACAPAHGQEFLSVPADSPLYEDLDHFRAMGLWRGRLELRPITRAELARAVRAIENSPRAGALSPGDQRRLQRLTLAIEAYGLTSRPASPAASDAPFPRVRWEFGAGVRFSGTMTQLDSLVDLDRRQRRDWGVALAVNAAVGRHVVVESRTYEDYSRLTPRPNHAHWVDNLPTTLKGVLTDPSARNDHAVLGIGWNWGELRYGREDRRWGTGRRGTLFLSENPFPIDGLSFNFRTRYLSGASLLGQIRRGRAGSDTLGAGRTGDAYIAGHRLEISPPGPARLGLFESVAYGGRGIDLGYANPVGLLVAITQDINDRSKVDDKKILGSDLQVSVRPFLFYGEFLLNRLVTLDAAKGGQNADASTFAELAGFRWADPLGWGGSDLEVEYAHLDPEVYFHHDKDPGRAFLSEGELIGHWAGPDADALYISLPAPPLAGWGTVRCSFEQVRWGLIQGRRGVDLGFAHVLKKDKRWITGAVQTERVASLEWTRLGWRFGLPVQLDTDCTLARVWRTGPRALNQTRWADSGWECEVRLTWRFELTRIDTGAE